MCCFNDPVAAVRKTRILVAPARQEGRQLTVYENEVLSSGGSGKAAMNAMVLPCPLHRPGSRVELVNLAGSAFFFDRLYALFPSYEDDLPQSDDDGGRMDWWGEESYLEVRQLGAYLVSVAPSLADLARYDPRVFTLSPTLFHAFGERYPAGFAFVICRFNAEGGTGEHPIAYIHDRQADGSLFVPCLHVHDRDKVRSKEKFDHEIYSLNARDAVVAGESADELRARLLAAYPDAKPNEWLEQERDNPYYAYEFNQAKKEKYHIRINVPTVTLDETLAACAELTAYWPAECRHLRYRRLYGNHPNEDLHFAV